MKRNFFHTEFATHAGFSSQMPRVLKYTIENRVFLLSPLEVDRMVSSIRMILQSPLAQYFDRIIRTSSLRYFAALNITDKNSSIPELLTATNLSLDMRQALTQNSSMALPEIRDKVLLNVTGYMKFNHTEGQYELKAIDLFQQMVVRGHLCMSYFDHEEWLNPSLAEFAVRSYSMILSNIIARYYDLTLLEQMSIAGVFAFLYSGLLSDKGSPNDPPLFNKCTFIGTRNDMENVKSLCQEHMENGDFTLTKAAEAISQIGPERMRKFSVSEINILCGNLGPDSLSTMIAFEYPPYWIYFLLLALSGTKIPLIFQMNNQRLMQEGKSKFLTRLLADANLFDSTRG